MSLEMGLIVPHTPRMCHEERTPEFQHELVHCMKQVAKEIESAKPDVIVLISCHWLSSFEHMVDATPHHQGILTAFECPDLISNVPYSYPGDEELATRMVEAGRQAGLPIVKVVDPTYVWDYGTVVPLRYLIPKGDIAVIDLSVTWAANLEETYRWGQIVGNVLRESGKRAIFASSGALSHNLVRGPATMPTISEQALDNQFLDYLNRNDLESAWKMLPQYARVSSVEAGGRHLAMLLGVLQDSYESKYYGYGQSSASANVVMSFRPLQAQPSPSEASDAIA